MLHVTYSIIYFINPLRAMEGKVQLQQNEHSSIITQPPKEANTNARNLLHVSDQFSALASACLEFDK